MSTFETIDPHVLFSILLLVHDSSRHSIFSVIRVNKLLYQAALPFVYRECRLDLTQMQLNDPGSMRDEPYGLAQQRIEILLNLPKDSLPLRAMKSITIHSAHSRWEYNGHSVRCTIKNESPREEKLRVAEKWDPLAQLLLRLPRITDFTFDCQEPIPIHLIQTLEKYHPSASLHIINWTRRLASLPVGDLNEEALARSPNLRTLSAQIITDESKIDYSLDAFQRIVALAPGLEHVHYTTRLASDPLVLCRCPPQEETTEHESKNLHIRDPIRKTLKTLQLDSVQERSLEIWGRYLDFDRLGCLILGGVDWVTLRFVTENRTFSHLKELKFEYARRWIDENEEDDVLVKLIASLDSLTSLSITGFEGADILKPICLNLGHSLRSLALHNIERGRDVRRVLSTEDIERVQKWIPSVEVLGLDINRSIGGALFSIFSQEADAEKETYMALSKFAHLRELTLHYDVGLKSIAQGKDNYMILTEFDIIQIWRAIEVPKLMRLDIFVGEPDRSIGRHAPGWRLREQSIRQRILVQQDERDDYEGELVVDMEYKERKTLRAHNKHQELNASVPTRTDNHVCFEV